MFRGYTYILIHIYIIMWRERESKHHPLYYIIIYSLDIHNVIHTHMPAYMHVYVCVHNNLL